MGGYEACKVVQEGGHKCGWSQDTNIYYISGIRTFQILFSSPPEFDFPVKDHAELGESLGIIDFRYIHVPGLQSDSAFGL